MMLEFAGIVSGNFGIHAEFDKKTGDHGVTRIYFFGDFPSGIRQIQITIPVNGDVAAVFEKSDRAADAGFGKPHVFADVNGANRIHFFRKDINRFKRHFARFLDVHDNLI